jgi:hypothetical protein
MFVDRIRNLFELRSAFTEQVRLQFPFHLS